MKYSEIYSRDLHATREGDRDTVYFMLLYGMKDINAIDHFASIRTLFSGTISCYYKTV